jgi:hypothetical protein
MMGDGGVCDIIFLERFFYNRKTRYGVRKNVWSLFERLSFIFLQKIINFIFKLL